MTKFAGAVRAVLFFAVLLCAARAFCEDWYFSNASGLALERSPSRLTALHAEWALSVEKKDENALPALVKPYFDSSFGIELRTLYQRGKPLQRQWLFRNERGVTRLNASLPVEKPAGQAKPEKTAEPAMESASLEAPEASGPASSFSNKTDAPEGRLPFIELYSEDRLLTAFHQLTSGGEQYITRYSYNTGILLKAETEFDGKLLWSDAFRYTRNFRLRRVVRSYGEKSERIDLYFPPQSPFINPESPYDNQLKMGALRDVFMLTPHKIVYDTDDMGRVLGEEHFDEEENKIAELSNVWTNGRITSISWSAGEIAGLTEFEFTASGERISEKNYRNGILERSVRYSGTKETEELYKGNKPVLRTVWEDGRRVSEERL